MAENYHQWSSKRFNFVYARSWTWYGVEMALATFLKVEKVQLRGLDDERGYSSTSTWSDTGEDDCSDLEDCQRYRMESHVHRWKHYIKRWRCLRHRDINNINIFNNIRTNFQFQQATAHFPTIDIMVPTIDIMVNFQSITMALAVLAALPSLWDASTSYRDRVTSSC